MKYLSKLRCFRVVSFLLCVAIMAMSIPMVAGALDYGDFDEETPVSTAENPTSASVTAESEWTSPVVQDVPLGLGEKTVAELQTMRVEDVALPETISLDVARQKGHVNRLYEQETDLQTVIFQNQSGNMTA